MTNPDKELAETFLKLGIEHAPTSGTVDEKKLKWSELDTSDLQRIRQFMGDDAPEPLLQELRKRGFHDAA